MATQSIGQKSAVGMSLRDLGFEIKKKQRSVDRWNKKRTSLLAKVAELETMILGEGGNLNGRAGSGKRHRNDMTLLKRIEKVLKGKTMSVTEIAAAVQEDGHRTTAKNHVVFRTQVNAAMINGPFKRVSRGKYTTK